MSVRAVEEEIKKIVDEAIAAHVEELHTEYVEEETPAEEPKEEEPAEEAEETSEETESEEDPFGKIRFCSFSFRTRDRARLPPAESPATMTSLAP